jgi:hypothetical protein
MKSLSFLLILFNSSFNVNDNIFKIAENESKLNCCNGQDSIKISYFEKKYNIKEEMIYCFELYFQIYDWLGVKYSYGKDSKKGIDCSHFVSNIYRKVYGININGSSSSIFDGCFKVREEDLKEGDLVFFRINKKKKISHVGIYLQNRQFVHATIDRGVIISNLDENYYKKYFITGGKPNSKTTYE